MIHESRNPYRAGRATDSCRVGSRATRYWLWLGVFGGIMGAGIPLAYGIYTIYVIRSRPPLPPGQAACGMPVVAALLAIVVGTPLGAFCLAAFGALFGGVLDLSVWLFSKRSAGVDKGSTDFDADETRPT